jgi:primary-amine oxidase
MYYRPNIDDLQYTYPLDFCPIYNIETQEIVHIDVPEKRRPLNTAPPTNYDAESIQRSIGLRDDLKPIHVTQPEGVSFKMDGRTIDWQKWNFPFNDRGNVRPVSTCADVHFGKNMTDRYAGILAYLTRRDGRTLR